MAVLLYKLTPTIRNFPGERAHGAKQVLGIKGLVTDFALYRGLVRRETSLNSWGVGSSDALPFIDP
jgi:hypothetical protein